MTHLESETVAIMKGVSGMDISCHQLEQFAIYQSLLMRWNKKVNLTAVRTPQGIERVHFIDSLTVLLQTGSLANQSLIDIGSGAGFPGLPLKILFPTLRLTLVESVRKKTTFLKEVVEELGLDGVTVLDERAEVLGREALYREKYDWAIARAVAELNVLLEYLAPFCQINGRILAMKGPEPSNEIEAATKAMFELNLKWLASHEVPKLYSGGKERVLVVFEKMGELSERYPRRPGIPTKRPLR